MTPSLVLTAKFGTPRLTPGALNNSGPPTRKSTTIVARVSLWEAVETGTHKLHGYLEDFVLLRFQR